MLPSILVIELHYLPSIAYFSYLSVFEKAIIDLSDPYIKQTYRNRCKISGANKVEYLIIPVKKSNEKKSFEIEIDYSQKWLNNHLRSLQSAYGKAPFFEYYAEGIFKVYRQQPRLLAELNKNLLTKCLEMLELQMEVEFSYDFHKSAQNEVYNAKNVIHPKKSLYKDPIFQPKKYFQVFGKDFEENLSVIDLIFCEGPRALEILKNSAVSNRQI
jgi:hypothetical protein